MNLYKTLGTVGLDPLSIFEDDQENKPTIVVQSQQPLVTSNLKVDLLQNLLHGQRYSQALSFKSYGDNQTDN